MRRSAGTRRSGGRRRGIRPQPRPHQPQQRPTRRSRSRSTVTHRGETQRRWSEPWSEDEIRFLRRFYKKLTAREIASELKRTLHSVRGKIRALGLTKA